MPVVSTTTQNQILDAWLGPARATGTADTYSHELWCGDPRDPDSVEASGGSYAAVTIDADNFGPAANGQTSATEATEFPAASSEYDDTVTHNVLRDPVTGEIAWCSPLAEPLDVTGSGSGPRVRPVIYFADPS